MSFVPAHVWGPPFWFFLHTIAMHYPERPNEHTKKQYYELLTHLPLFLPATDSQHRFAQLLEQYPVSPYLTNRLSLMRWMHFIHNQVNVLLEKPILSFSDHVHQYQQYQHPSVQPSVSSSSVHLLSFPSSFRKLAVHILLFGGLVSTVFWITTHP